MEEGRGVPEALVDKLEALKKKQEDLISILKDIKQVLLELNQMDEEDRYQMLAQLLEQNIS